MYITKMNEHSLIFIIGSELGIIKRIVELKA